METNLELSHFLLPNQLKLHATSQNYAFEAMAVAAAVANADGLLLWQEYEVYQSVAQKILGSSAMESSSARVVSLQFLLHPGILKNRVDALLDAIVKQQVSRRSCETIVTQLLYLLDSSPQSDPSGILVVRNLIDSLGIPLSEYAQRIDRLQLKNNLAGMPVAQRAQNLTQAATSLIGSTVAKVSSFWSKGKGASQSRKDEPTIRTAVTDINRSAVEFSDQAAKIGNGVNSPAIVEKTKEFLEQLKPQDFKIAIVGEMKHGKSSIFNSIVGEPISPIGESTATTASVVELLYSEHPTYEGKWLGQNHLAKLNDYIQENSTSVRVGNYGRLLDFATKSGEFEPAGPIHDLDSLAKISDYVTAKGCFSCAVERIRIGLPIEELKLGGSIIDTPGINDPMRVRDFITLNEAKTADCVVFVMRADKLGTESERVFLQSLLETGRVHHLILVVTHVDRLSTPADVNRAIAAAKQWLQELSTDYADQPVVHSAKVFGFNSSDIDKIYGTNGFKQFWTELCDVAASNKSGSEYCEWVENRKLAIRNFVTEEVKQHEVQTLKSLPDETAIDSLKKMVTRFSSLAETYSNQIAGRMDSIKGRLKLDFKHLVEDLDRFKDDCLKEIRAEVEQLVRQSGKDYHLESNWKQFDSVTSANIIRTRLQEFSQRIQERMNLWNSEFERFAAENDELVQRHLQELQATRQEFAGITSTNHGLISQLCKIDRIVASAERAVLSGATAFTLVGGTVLLSTGSSVFFTTALGLLTGGTAIPVIAGVSLAAWGVHRMTSDPEKRKQKFIDQKIEKAKQALDQHFSSVTQTVRCDMINIWDAFRVNAENHHSALILEALASKEEAQLQLEVSDRIRKDTLTHLQKVKSDLISLER